MNPRLPEHNILSLDGPILRFEILSSQHLPPEVKHAVGAYRWATADSADCVPEFQYLDPTRGFHDRKSQISKIMSQATRDMISVYGKHLQKDSNSEKPG